MNCQTFSLPPLENTPISWQKKKKKKSNKRERRKGRKRRKTASLFPRRVKRCSLLLFCHVASRTNTIYYYSFDPLLSLSLLLALARSLARSFSFSFSLSALQTNELFIDNNTDGSRNNPVGDWNKPLRLAARFLNANQVSQNVSK